MQNIKCLLLSAVFAFAPLVLLARHTDEEEKLPIEPLLTFVRDQTAPYNNCCPRFTYADGTQSERRAKVGCLATALEEVISHYRRVITLKDTLFGWSTPHYTIDDILPGTSVDTRLIRDDYRKELCSEEEIDAVARLSYYCGVAARMNYGLGESGANITDLVEPLKRAFGFGTVQYLDSYRYKPNDWKRILETEIRSGRPLLYSGFMTTKGGHAFVLDGIDEKGCFHVNWGYGGAYDAYSDINVLHAFEPDYDRTDFGDAYGFANNCQALIVHPDSIDLQLPDSLSRTGREIAVDSLRFLQVPERGKYTELLIYFRNSSADSLITPFAVFTNAPEDSSIYEQADCAGLTGTVLAPGQTVVKRLPLIFSEAGERILRISPDDSTIVWESPISILEERKAKPEFGDPELLFPKDSVVQVLCPIGNLEGEGRMGHIITYCLFEGDLPEEQEGDVRHPRLCTVAAGTSVVDTVCFRGLIPGKHYTLLVRQPWTVRAQCSFVLPDATGITAPADDAGRVLWFTTDGRRIEKPCENGIYLRRKSGKTEKMIYRKQ